MVGTKSEAVTYKLNEACRDDVSGICGSMGIVPYCSRYRERCRSFGEVLASWVLGGRR